MSNLIDDLIAGMPENGWRRAVDMPPVDLAAIGREVRQRMAAEHALLSPGERCRACGMRACGRTVP